MSLPAGEAYGEVRRVLWAVLAANLAVTALKIGLGVTTGALSVVADGFHSMVDSSSNLIGLAAIRLAARPADEQHPYGYQRYETLGALAIGAMMLAAAYEIGRAIFERILTGAAPEISTFAVGLMLLTLPANGLVVILETRAGRRLGSEILLADARHTTTDLFVTFSVLASLIGVRLGWGWLDAVVAGGVVILIVRAAFGILRDTSDTLTDKMAVDPQRVEAIAAGSPGVRYVHRVRSRGAAGAAFVDLHVKVDPTMNTAQAHAVASEVERRLKEELAEVSDALVHIEPAARQQLTNWERMAVDLRGIADGLGLGLHDLHIHTDLNGRYTIELHLEIRGATSLGAAHALADNFESRVREHWPEAERILTHLEPMPEGVLPPGEEVDESMADAVRTLLLRHVAAGQIAECRVDSVAGHLQAAVTLTLPAETSLTDAHGLTERIETHLLASDLDLTRVTVHAEPPSE
ncbi:MAG: cation transporter [Anaerolineae bacterium]|nr:MAG: cation transporter [Anaerolineae bacterium]